MIAFGALPTAWLWPTVADAPSDQVGSWKVLAPAPDPHPSDHTATLLFDGRVLVVGGPGPAGTGFRDMSRFVSKSADLYAPATRSWSATGSTNFPRAYHTATLLFDGRVLVAGGALNDGQRLATTELYDPATGRWSLTGSLHEGRSGHTATLLRNGKVLVTGGHTRVDTQYKPTVSAELYDPATGRWTATAPMAVSRAEHAAVLLPSGMVLVVGGRAESEVGTAPLTGFSLKSAETYDPLTGGWQLVPHLLHTARAGSAATLLMDGRVLVTGGSTRQYHGGSGDPTPTTEIYDPAARTWTSVAPMLTARLAHTATLLPDGRVVVVGGLAHRRDNSYVNPIRSAEIYDPRGDQWSPLAPPPAETQSGSDRTETELMVGGYHTATLLPKGVSTALSAPILVVGSTSGTTAQLFSIAGFADQPTSGTNRMRWIYAGGGAAAVLVVGLTAWIIHRRRQPW